MEISPKHLNHLLDRLRQRIDLFLRVVESKRGARRGRDVESFHHRLGAVMTGANGDAFLIQNRADVVRVNVVNHEGQHAQLFTRGTDDAYAFDGGNTLGGIDEQLVFIRRRFFAADDAQVING